MDWLVTLILILLVSLSVFKIGGFLINRFYPPVSRTASVVAIRTEGRKRCFVTCEFADGSRREFRTDHQFCDQVAVGDAGTLTYRGNFALNLDR